MTLNIFLYIMHSYIFFVKCLLVFCSDFNWIVFSLLLVLYQKYNFQILSIILPACDPFFFHFLNGTLERKRLHFDKVQLTDFFFLLSIMLLVSYIRCFNLICGHRDFSVIFPPGNVVVLALAFKSMISFQLFFVCMVQGKCQNSLVHFTSFHSPLFLQPPLLFLILTDSYALMETSF